MSELALGKDHALLLTTESQLYSFGSNQYGQLGLAKSIKNEESKTDLGKSFTEEAEIMQSN